MSCASAPRKRMRKRPCPSVRKLSHSEESVVRVSCSRRSNARYTIDTIRTFFLVVLAILGPISFAISVWDGFHNTLVQWICRYIQTYLWLPVADLFSTILAKIQVLMLQTDISELTNNPNVDLDGSNTAYTIFMIIGIIGYFTIPTVAGWIIQAGGMGSYNRSINNTAMTGGSWAGSVAGGVTGNVARRIGKLLK